MCRLHRPTFQHAACRQAFAPAGHRVRFPAPKLPLTQFIPAQLSQPVEKSRRQTAARPNRPPPIARERMVVKGLLGPSQARA
jgi:hypothetical protein